MRVRMKRGRFHAARRSILTTIGPLPAAIPDPARFPGACGRSCCYSRGPSRPRSLDDFVGAGCGRHLASIATVVGQLFLAVSWLGALALAAAARSRHRLSGLFFLLAAGCVRAAADAARAEPRPTGLRRLDRNTGHAASAFATAMADEASRSRPQILSRSCSGVPISNGLCAPPTPLGPATPVPRLALRDPLRRARAW